MWSVLECGLTTCAHTPKENSEFPRLPKVLIPTRGKKRLTFECTVGFPQTTEAEEGRLSCRLSDLNQLQRSLAGTIPVASQSKSTLAWLKREMKRMFGFSSSCLSFPGVTRNINFQLAVAGACQHQTCLRPLGCDSSRSPCRCSTGRMGITDAPQTRVSVPRRPTPEHLCLAKCEQDVRFPHWLMGRSSARMLRIVLPLVLHLVLNSVMN